MTGENQPVLEELNPNACKLYVIFGGIAGAIGMPPFEFYKSSRILNENKIFLRDISKSWYQCGLPGIAKNAYEIGEFLEGKISEIAPEEVYFVGNSMGGYAAILFASMLGKGKAIAFSPTIFISPFIRLMHFDRRRIKLAIKMYKKTFFDSPAPIYDLIKWLKKDNRGFTGEIHVSKKPKDLKYAQLLEKFDNIKITKYDYGGHGLVKHLRNTEQLYKIFTQQSTEPDRFSAVLSSGR